MTTPAKPERMTEKRLAWIDDPGRELNGHLVYDELRAEARRARAEESRLSRELEATEHLIDAYASELGTLVCQVLEADSRAGGYRKAAKRLAACFERLDQQIVGFALDAGMSPTISNTRCVYCGEQRPAKGTWEKEAAVWIEHAKTCPRHPWRETEWERDAAQAVAKEAGRQLGEAGAARLKAECERDALGRQIDEFAVAVGYGERPDGRSGVVRPELPELSRLLLAERDAAEAAQREAELQRDYARAALEIASKARDAARKEAERLRNEMSTMRPDLGWDDNEFK